MKTPKKTLLRWHKPLSRLLVLLTIIAGLAFLNNIVAAWRWYALVAQGMLDMEPQGFSRWLNPTAVDMSTVSTFIPFYGLIFITRAFKRIRTTRFITPHYPFTPSYDRIMISLGLIGTLWGIIMLGYYPPDQVTMPNLIACLHTSLYSTMIAVIWVFVILNAVRHFMRWYHGVVCDDAAAEDEVEDLSELFTALTQSVSTTGHTLQKTSEDVAAFRSRLHEMSEEFSDVLTHVKTFKERVGVDVYTHIEQVCTRIGSALEGLHAETAHLQQRSSGFETLLQQVGRILEQKERILTSFGTHVTTLTAERAAIQSQMEEVMTAYRTCEEQLAATRSALREAEAAKAAADAAVQRAEERVTDARAAQKTAEEEMTEARRASAEYAERVCNAQQAQHTAESEKVAAETARARAEEELAQARAAHTALQSQFEGMQSRLKKIGEILSA